MPTESEWLAPVPYSGKTKLIFIVGDPIAQVKSPAGLTKYIRTQGIDLIVIPAQVAEADFNEFIHTAERMKNVTGLIITVPHKFAAHQLCTHLDPVAARVGSVNLMRFREEEGWFGAMTDGKGCVAVLGRKGYRTAGKKTLLVGAGGAGIAVADALVEAGVEELCVYDTKWERATNLAATIQGHSTQGHSTESNATKNPTITIATQPPNPERFDLVVNATLLGTAADDPLPIPADHLTEDTAVADLACGPHGCTRLISTAAQRGCLTMTGDEMFESMIEMLAEFFCKDHHLQAYSSVSLAETGADSPADQLRHLLNGYQATQVIHVASVLGVADHLTASPLPVAAISEAVGADPEALYRLLRALSALGIFTEHNERSFSLTPMGALLRSDSVPSLRPWAMFLAEEKRWQTWGHLLQSVRTGTNAFRMLYGMDSWEYRRQNPEQAALFHKAMAANSQQIDQAVVATCDLTGVNHLGDIGGGHGSLISTFLKAHPELHGTLFDQPEVIAMAKEANQLSGVEERCRMIGGDMFREVPVGCDALVMKFILHDWDDQDAISVLRSCRNALPHGGSVFIVEYLLEPPNQGLYEKMSDLNMLVGPGGCERTVDQYIELLETAGFSRPSALKTSKRVHVMQAKAL